MYQQIISSIFRSKADFSDDEIGDLISKWHVRRKLKRNDFLIARGETEHFLYFVERGVMRLFYQHGEETDVTVGFAYENTLINSYPSFIRQKPSDYYIQCLSACEVVGISRKDLYNFIDESKVVQIFIDQQKQLLELLMQSETIELSASYIPISLSQYIKINFGDALRFVIYHNERHMKQAGRVLIQIPYL